MSKNGEKILEVVRPHHFRYSFKAGDRGIFKKIRRFIIGTPIASKHELKHRVNKLRALAIFSSDPLSSVAYGPEQVLLVLFAAGASVLWLGIPITLVVILFVLIVVTSYNQTIHAYPSGGGSFIVARENLGVMPGLIAAGALLTDYVLTVSVSVAAGMSAVVSVFPHIEPYRVFIGVICILILTLVNLRGLRESGTIFALPTYVFIFSVLGVIFYGIFRILFLHQALVVTNAVPTVVPAETLSLWLILRAFSSGSSTLTGIEAVSNGVPSFKSPESKNAAMTMSFMAIFLAIMALGIVFLAYAIHAVPSDTETILSQVGRTIIGNNGIFYLILQASTTLILILAANTSFADFPRLSSILAKHKFTPHQMAFRGDKLAFTNGIFILGILASLLLIIFGGSEHYLIPLYAVGVFTSFTLSQSGMVMRWRRLRTAHWKGHMLINLIGAITTFIVLIVVIVTKFTQGAWAIVVIIPVLVGVMKMIHSHYSEIDYQLEPSTHKIRKYSNTYVVPISRVDKHTLHALDYVRSVSSPENVIAVHVTEDPKIEKTRNIKKLWKKHVPDIPLTLLESPYRTLIDPLTTFIFNLKKEKGDGLVTVVVSDYQPAHWWEHVLHTHSSLRLKTALRDKRGIVLLNIHYHINYYRR